MAAHAFYAVPLGLLLVALGLTDVFFTILHADRQGPVSRWANLVVWRTLRALAGRSRRMRRELLAVAGPMMMATTVLLWAGLLVLGFAFLYWPFLAQGFLVHPALGPPRFVHALYFSGVTFTTLGFGDVTPLAPLWKLVSVVEALGGFGVMSAAITYLLTIFIGLEERNAAALRVMAETGSTGRGARFVARALRDEGPEGLRRRLEEWAHLARHMQEKVHRFPILVFYYRTRDPDKDPEPMFRAMAEAAVAARLLARAEGMGPVRSAAEHLDVALRQLIGAITGHHARRPVRRALAAPAPDDTDRRLLEEARREVERETGVPVPPPPPDEERALLDTLHRTRAFLAEVDRLTAWRTLHEA